MNESTQSVYPTSTSRTPRLSRVLNLWDLIFYGVILISPIAAVPLFGVIQELSQGHAVTSILVAMGAISLTAVSYGRMAVLYPSAGSAYTYVGRGINPHLGFLVGWAMFLDYIMQPILNCIIASLALQRLLPKVPYFVLSAVFLAVITYLNLRGIRSTARTNQILLVFMSTIITLFIGLAIQYLFAMHGWRGLFSIRPFYNPRTFSFRTVATGTSLAALTYIGFDGVSLLAEEVDNPRRNVLLASVLVCLFTGVFSGLQIYLAQLVWPDFHTFPSAETAFMDVASVVGGATLFNGFAGMLVLTSLGCGLTGQVCLARLLFCMGRDKVLPGIFARVDEKRSSPTYNLLLIGVLAYAGALLMSFEQAAELINFGAFLAFMGVNLATMREYYFLRRAGQRRRFWSDVLLPGVGFLFCLVIWLNLQRPAKIVGGIWLAVGLIYGAVKTRGYRTKPVMVDFNIDF
ncbi:MAG: APC family permease [Terriglobia bacterium]|jgi:amino acid transporter